MILYVCGCFACTSVCVPHACLLPMEARLLQLQVGMRHARI